mmetsp:Transcript_4244/g.5762  ORF Transcript_4244/g.5762 Transcript_4244/m.5762 type:complete len:277 (+) Transcript_4244:396-1226(+)
MLPEILFTISSSRIAPRRSDVDRETTHSKLLSLPFVSDKKAALSAGYNDWIQRLKVNLLGVFIILFSFSFKSWASKKLCSFCASWSCFSIAEIELVFPFRSLISSLSSCASRKRCSFTNRSRSAWSVLIFLSRMPMWFSARLSFSRSKMNSAGSSGSFSASSLVIQVRNSLDFNPFSVNFSFPGSFTWLLLPPRAICKFIERTRTTAPCSEGIETVQNTSLPSAMWPSCPLYFGNFFKPTIFTFDPGFNSSSSKAVRRMVSTRFTPDCCLVMAGIF